MLKHVRREFVLWYDTAQLCDWLMHAKNVPRVYLCGEPLGASPLRGRHRLPRCGLLTGSAMSAEPVDICGLAWSVPGRNAFRASSPMLRGPWSLAAAVVVSPHGLLVQ